jgi:predicted XRE-type DNA-binding protein
MSPDPYQAANMVARSELMLLIAQEIKDRSWTQQQAASFFGVNQPRISDLVNGRLDKFTVDMLMNWLEKLGKDVSVAVRPNIFSASEKMSLTLFAVGVDNERTFAEINRLFGGDESRYELTVVNVLENPQLAREERISATPCLVKTFPPPRVVLIGDFSPTSVRWQLANAELVDAENRETAAVLREAKLDERERTSDERERRDERSAKQDR